MASFRRVLMAACFTLLLTLSLAACDGLGTQGTNTGNTPNNTNGTKYQMGTTPTTTHTTPTVQATMPAYNYGPTPTSAATTTTTTGNNSAFIQTTIVMINGKQVHVLTTSKGYILYYYMKDTMLTSNCTGGCAKAWPPLLAPSGATTISSSVMLPKKLSIHMTANGNQVFYDGHALYTYTADMKPGQFSGRGMGNAWYLAGITL